MNGRHGSGSQAPVRRSSYVPLCEALIHSTSRAGPRWPAILESLTPSRMRRPEPRGRDASCSRATAATKPGAPVPFATPNGHGGGRGMVVSETTACVLLPSPLPLPLSPLGRGAFARPPSRGEGACRRSLPRPRWERENWRALPARLPRQPRGGNRQRPDATIVPDQFESTARSSFEPRPSGARSW